MFVRVLSCSILAVETSPIGECHIPFGRVPAVESVYVTDCHVAFGPVLAVQFRLVAFR